jgi:hypothetical protein
MRLAMANFLTTIADALSAHQREAYERAVTHIMAALDSGKLKSTDKVALATPVIDAGKPGWLSPLDRVDWIGLHLLADEHKLPLETVNDLVSILQVAIGKA